MLFTQLVILSQRQGVDADADNDLVDSAGECGDQDG